MGTFIFIFYISLNHLYRESLPKNLWFTYLQVYIIQERAFCYDPRGSQRNVSWLQMMINFSLHVVVHAFSKYSLWQLHCPLLKRKAHKTPPWWFYVDTRLGRVKRSRLLRIDGEHLTCTYVSLKLSSHKNWMTCKPALDGALMTSFFFPDDFHSEVVAIESNLHWRWRSNVVQLTTHFREGKWI